LGIGRRAVGSGFEFRARVSFHLNRVANFKVRGIRNIDLVELHREYRLWCCGVSCEGVHFIRVSRTVFQLLFLKIFAFARVYRQVVRRRCCLVDLVFEDRRK
jgi:hypothetical protein